MPLGSSPNRRLWQMLAATALLAELAHLRTHLRPPVLRASTMTGQPLGMAAAGTYPMTADETEMSVPGTAGTAEYSTQGQLPATKSSSAVQGISRMSGARVGLDIVSAFAAMVVVSYGFVRPAYDAFYTQLGLTPEDVGLDQKYIIFRAALNVTREVLFIAGLAVFTWSIERGVHAILRRFGLASRIISTAVALTVSILCCLMAYLPLRPGDRTAALIGFGVGLLLLLLFSPFALLGRARIVAACVAVICLASVSYAFQYYLDAARQEGRQFLQTGRVIGSWGFVLAIQYHTVQPVALRGDPAHICTDPAYFTLLGSSSRSDTENFLLIRKPSAAFVARISTNDYGMRSGLPKGAYACIRGP
jgi:hypothetical protein